MMLLVKLFYRDKTMGMAQSDNTMDAYQDKAMSNTIPKNFWVVNN